MTANHENLIENYIIAASESLATLRDELKRRGVPVRLSKKARRIEQVAREIQRKRMRQNGAK